MGQTESKQSIVQMGPAARTILYVKALGGVYGTWFMNTVGPAYVHRRVGAERGHSFVGQQLVRQIFCQSLGQCRMGPTESSDHDSSLYGNGVRVADWAGC